MNSPWLAACIVAFVYGLWLAVYLRTGHSLRDFIHIGRYFATAHHIGTDKGYDGQFSYYLAVDPLHAAYHMDSPVYRYVRIVYPLTARLVALGHGSAVPYSLVAVNLIGLAGGTLMVALWLQRSGMSPLIALVYGLYPGLFTSFLRDLTEVLAYGLVALAVYLFDFGGSRRILWSGICFALAALTRETTLVFSVLYALSIALQPGERRAEIRKALSMMGLAVGPFLLYEAFLRHWLGSASVPVHLHPELIPFAGLFSGSWRFDKTYAVVSVVVPALICVLVAVSVLRRNWAHPEPWVLLANGLLFVILLSPEPYSDIFASARVTTGVVLAAIFCFPIFRRSAGTAWFKISSICWLAFAPFWFLAVPWRELTS